jgi:hypothetical protein
LPWLALNLDPPDLCLPAHLLSPHRQGDGVGGGQRRADTGHVLSSVSEAWGSLEHLTDPRPENVLVPRLGGSGCDLGTWPVCHMCDSGFDPQLQTNRSVDQLIGHWPLSLERPLSCSCSCHHGTMGTWCGGGTVPFAGSRVRSPISCHLGSGDFWVPCVVPPMSKVVIKCHQKQVTL